MMSFLHQTPESLLTRSDSKDPATTCKGLTSTGRPCRRALAANITNSPLMSTDMKGKGVVAILDAGTAAAFFCWQHKDQAEALVTKLSQRTRVVPLKEKSSIDTLIDRIGVVHLDDDIQQQERQTQQQEYNGERQEVRQQYTEHGQSSTKASHKREHIDSSRKRNTLPPEWQRIQGPLMTVPEDVVQPHGYKHSTKPREHRTQQSTRRIGESNVKASWSCCLRADAEDLPPPRRRDKGYDDHRYRARSKPQSHSQSRHNSQGPNTYHTQPNRQTQMTLQSEHMTSNHTRPILSAHNAPHISQVSTPRRKLSNTPDMQHVSSAVSSPQLDHLQPNTTATPARPPLVVHSSSSPPNSQTMALLSMIPPHLSPATTSALLSELSKPISPADEEGYIYIFWLTPESDDSKPDDETASTLLDYDDLSPEPSPYRRPRDGQQRRPSEADRRQIKNQLTAQALQRFASVKYSSSEPRKILLKIGRANNVYRRLSQWSKQCGQNITLIRYYPYHSQQSSQYASGKVTVPHVHRVERLIHLELADQRVTDKGRCEQCGREHKEWFEVEATRAGVRAVDEVVRRWVEWAQQQEYRTALL